MALVKSLGSVAANRVTVGGDAIDLQAVNLYDTAGNAIGPGAALSAASLPVTDALDNGATSAARLLSAAASTNATSVKASAGFVYRVRGYNNNAAARFLKFYNKASAPTVGTDTPVLTYRIAPTADFAFDVCLYFATGIAFAITTAAADADTGALTAGDIVALNITYK